MWWNAVLQLSHEAVHWRWLGEALCQTARSAGSACSPPRVGGEASVVVHLQLGKQPCLQWTGVGADLEKSLPLALANWFFLMRTRTSFSPFVWSQKHCPAWSEWSRSDCSRRCYPWNSWSERLGVETAGRFHFIILSPVSLERSQWVPSFSESNHAVPSTVLSGAETLWP